jgi:chemotaxis response regulator CheB
MARAGGTQPFFVVGIGASAGGLEAFIELPGAMPATRAPQP